MGSVKRILNEFLKQVAPEYKLQGLLGSGSFGSVYLLRLKYGVTPNPNAGPWPDEIAVKIIRSKSGPVSYPAHPNAMEIFSCFFVSDFTIIVQEYVEGDTLNEILLESSPHRLVCILMQIASVLEYMHFRQCCHRDLKPENIMVRRTEKGDDVKLVDFDLLSNRYSNTFCGTPGFVAPEVLKRAVYDGCKADMYSFGKICEIVNRVVQHERLKELVEDCKKDFPSQRPSATLCLKTLQEIMGEERDDFHTSIVDKLDFIVTEVISRSSGETRESMEEQSKRLTEAARAHRTTWKKRLEKMKRTFFSHNR